MAATFPNAASAEQAVPCGGLAGAASSPEAAAAVARARAIADRSRELAGAHDQCQLFLEEARLGGAGGGEVVQLQYFDYRGVPLVVVSWTFGEVGAPTGAAARPAGRSHGAPSRPLPANAAGSGKARGDTGC
jgi:hypothetical protein